MPKITADEARELAGPTIEERVDAWFDEDGHSYSRPAWNEKFAELIVAECANIDFRAKLGLSGDDAFAVSESIKDHFGY